MPTVQDDDLLPFSRSGFAWRWVDPKYDTLSPNTLDAIRCCNSDAARAVFRRVIDLDNWAREKPDRVLRTTDVDPEVVSRWLEEGHPTTERRVLASWSEDEAIVLPWRIFVRYWSSFCYPSSDDVTVLPLSEAWALSYSHDGHYYWRSRGGGTSSNKGMNQTKG